MVSKTIYREPEAGDPLPYRLTRKARRLVKMLKKQKVVKE